MEPQLRLCVGCRRLQPRSLLLRLVRGADGQVQIEHGGKRVQGRGAYVCRTGTCWQDVRKRRSLEKALKVPISAEVWQGMERFFTS